MAYDARAIANYLIDRAAMDGETLNPMKLQKLVYNAHGFCLAALNRPLIDEEIQAWTYGPVIPSIYHEFKKYGSGGIKEKARVVHFEDGLKYRFITPSIDSYPNAQENQETRDLLDAVWESFGDLSAVQLSNLTHRPGTPWSVTVEQNPGRKGINIPQDRLKEWFAA